jgi:uncharacterized protein involved in exopolysaccharide biosynthesis
MGLLPLGEGPDFFSYAAGTVKEDMISINLANQLSDVLAIAVYGPTTQLAQDIANYLAERLIAMVVNGEQDSARFAVDFAHQHLDDISAKLGSAEDSLTSYQKELEVLDVSKQKGLQMNQNDALMTQMQSLERAHEELKKRLEVMNEQIEGQKKAYVSIITLQKDISDREKVIQDLAANEESERVVKEQYRESKGRARELIEADHISKKLEREISIYSNIWGQFQDKLAKLNIETVSRLKALSMEIVDRAYLPPSADPIWPKKIFLCVLGAILGIITGLIVPFVIEYFNDSVSNKIEAEKELNIPVLSSISEFHFPA